MKRQSDLVLWNPARHKPATFPSQLNPETMLLFCFHLCCPDHYVVQCAVRESLPRGAIQAVSTSTRPPLADLGFTRGPCRANSSQDRSKASALLAHHTHIAFIAQIHFPLVDPDLLLVEVLSIVMHPFR